jgi:hypothetical protein
MDEVMFSMEAGMSSKEKILLEELVCAIQAGSALNGKFIEEKIGSLREDVAGPEVSVHELRKLALVFLDSLFAEESDKH